MKSAHLLLKFASRRESKVLIGRELLADPATWQFLSDAPKLAVITNGTVREIYAEQLCKALPKHADVFEMEDGEEHKTLNTFADLVDRLVDLGHNRTSVVIALGGGVVGDLAGFVAATFQRGIRLIQVPTTLLAQVDSSVGGKTAVNHSRGKNLIGAFCQPELVVVDTKTLDTLPQRIYIEGLAEIVKYGVIDDAEFFGWLETNKTALLERNQTALMHAVTRSCEIKAKIVELDELESGKRMLLNLGHTFGHGLENAAGYGSILHGEAVAIGMKLALDLSAKLGLCAHATANRVEKLLESLELPTQIPQGTSIADVENAMSRDKKAIGSRLRFILVREIGNASVETHIDPELLRTTLESNQLN